MDITATMLLHIIAIPASIAAGYMLGTFHMMRKIRKAVERLHGQQQEDPRSHLRVVRSDDGDAR